jgi:hypothetical protein
VKGELVREELKGRKVSRRKGKGGRVFKEGEKESK